MKSNFWKVWGMPIFIGLLSSVGLISALTGDGIFDLISWLTLGFAVAVMGWYTMKPGKWISKKS